MHWNWSLPSVWHQCLSLVSQNFTDGSNLCNEHNLWAAYACVCNTDSWSWDPCCTHMQFHKDISSWVRTLQTQVFMKPIKIFILLQIWEHQILSPPQGEWQMQCASLKNVPCKMYHWSMNIHLKHLTFLLPTIDWSPLDHTFPRKKGQMLENNFRSVENISSLPFFRFSVLFGKQVKKSSKNHFW